MTTGKMLVYVLVMAGVTYLIRMLPLVLFRKKINNTFVRSFLYYVPYTVLAAMIFPAAIYATGSVVSGIVGLAVALIVALVKGDLLVVALSSAAGVFITERILFFLGKIPY